MADDDINPAAEGALPNGEDTAAQIGLIAQYVKDLSFENPNAPAVYQAQVQPQIDVQFHIGVGPVAVVGVSREPVRDEVAPLGACRALAGR